jgi:hypothetical protein
MPLICRTATTQHAPARPNVEVTIAVAVPTLWLGIAPLLLFVIRLIRNRKLIGAA